MRSVNTDPLISIASSRLLPDLNRYSRVSGPVSPGSIWSSWGSSGKELYFPCMRWLSRTKEDGSLVREMAAPGTQLRDFRLPGRLYTFKPSPVDALALALQDDRLPSKSDKLVGWFGVNDSNLQLAFSGTN